MAADRVGIYGTDACPYTATARKDCAERGLRSRTTMSHRVLRSSMRCWS
jgi:hypothetical protein